jgi:hypothetical protein
VARHALGIKEKVNACKILIGIAERKRPHGTIRHREEYNIKTGM